MSSLSLIKARLITAGSLSLLAQVVLLTPFSLDLFLQFFPPFGTVAIALTLFAASLYFYIVAFRVLSMKSLIGWRSNRLLLAIQILSITGIFFILGNNVSGDVWAGFLLTSLITLITTYLMFPDNTSEMDFREPAVKTDTIISELTSDTDAT